MYGVYSKWSKKWCFGIAEPTKGKAFQALYAKIGKDSYKWRFEIKQIPDDINVHKVNHKPKTRNGIRRFITNWLARTQNAGGTKGVGSVNRPFNAIPDRNRIKDDSEYDHPTNINHNPFFQAHMEKIRKGD